MFWDNNYILRTNINNNIEKKSTGSNFSKKKNTHLKQKVSKYLVYYITKTTN